MFATSDREDLRASALTLVRYWIFALAIIREADKDAQTMSSSDLRELGAGCPPGDASAHSVDGALCAIAQAAEKSEGSSFGEVVFPCESAWVHS